MALGQYLKLGGVVTDPSLPFFYPEDSRINKGSLLLVNFANSLGYEGSNPPITGTLVYNLAWRAAKAMIGTGDRTSLSLVANVPFGAAEGKLEFTPKKGLHVITSQVNMGQGKGFSMLIPPAIMAYLHQYSDTHQYYFRISERLTRQPDLNSGDDNRLVIASNSGASGNYLARMAKGGSLPNASTANSFGGSFSSQSATALGNLFRNVATKAWTGTKQANPADITNRFISVGPVGAYQSIDVNKSSSTVLYEIYIEDLTVSGRTYAQAHAAELAIHNADFGAGGRFSGDTIPTDPSTLP
ncbi:hypothetical protein BWI97_15670 [Siphonobacter sp. BAB-5405]|uniref:hypothetical protein n=1 Tax=Siphonobacter sp. BAB-5405 TaxID=1864825 RepID=UPI000C7F829C|nr:hypothetical protein [Siphonobacter sp. BAB-5405]PMD94834.1 hypothetical protein BWI97_15670 [Siphonobacter sp. BAB-5405]